MRSVLSILVALLVLAACRRGGPTSEVPTPASQAEAAVIANEPLRRTLEALSPTDIASVAVSMSEASTETIDIPTAKWAGLISALQRLEPMQAPGSPSPSEQTVSDQTFKGVIYISRGNGALLKVTLVEWAGKTGSVYASVYSQRDQLLATYDGTGLRDWLTDAASR